MGKVKGAIKIYCTAVVLLLLLDHVFGQQLGTGKKFLMQSVKMQSGSSQSNIAKIQGYLSAKPIGFGYDCTNRQFWESLRNIKQYQQVIKDADLILAKGFPQWNDSQYLSFFTKGDAVSGKNMVMNRLTGLMNLAWAACLTNENKYITSLEKNLLSVVNQESWVYARSDSKKQNYSGKYYTIDLSSASYAHNLAQILYLLGPKLSASVRQQVYDALEKRIFKPTKDLANGRYPYDKWPEMRNNWNAVCLSGVVGAALTVIDDKSERAFFIDFATKYIHNYLSGFLKDGYCSEGINYYNYGYRTFILLRENILRSTNGKIDIFKSNDLSGTNMFLYNIEIWNGIFPTIGDTPGNSKPSAFVVNYLNKKFNAPILKSSLMGYEPRTRNLTYCLLSLEKGIDTYAISSKSSTYEPKIRSEFPYAGILICRPKTKSKNSIAAMFKGGDNAENHNHNDLGEYCIVSGEELLVEDPGQITYTADIFGKKRYTYKSISSYGHPVPLVAGVQQTSGSKAEAKVIKKELTDRQDVITYDLKSAYKAPSLQNLTRACKYIRDNTHGKVVIEDMFVFSSPQTFETAIITRGKVIMQKDGSVLISGKKNKLVMRPVETSGRKLKISSETINEAGSKSYTRIAISPVSKLTKGRIRLEYSSI